MDASNILNPCLSQAKLNSKLVKAAQQGNCAEVQSLLEAGADVNATKKDYGWTPLIVAARNGEMAVAELLINKGADVHVIDFNGLTLLMYATFNGCTAIAERLINEGADVTVTSKSGTTALMYAARCDHRAVAFHILSVMTPEEIIAFTKNNPEHTSLVNQFKQALKDNTNKLYNILMPSLKAFPGSPFLLLPSELVKHILTLEVLVQDFPEWYRYRIKSDLASTIQFVQDNKKVPALIFSSDAPGSHKTKTEDTLEESMTKKLNLSDDDENSATKSGCFLPFRM